MVGDTGTLSNSTGTLKCNWNKNSDELSAVLQNRLTPELTAQLFEELAEWNEYLENNVPFFRAPR